MFLDDPSMDMVSTVRESKTACGVSFDIESAAPCRRDGRGRIFVGPNSAFGELPPQTLYAGADQHPAHQEK
jgi:hypothetical protein